MENEASEEKKCISSEGNQLVIEKLTPRRQADKHSDTLFLYFSVFTGILLWFVSGASMVWTSPALVKMKSNDVNVNPLGRPITTIETSLLLGVPCMSALLGTSVLPKLADLFGRKRSLQIMCLGMFFGVLGMAFSNRIELITMFASVNLISTGGIWASGTIYLTEICEDRNRGRYCCMLALSIPLGELYVYFIGTTFGYRNFTLVMGAPLIVYLVLSLFAPESPVFDLTRGRRAQCVKNLKKLRYYRTEADLELDIEQISRNIAPRNRKNGVRLFQLFSTKEGRIGLMLAALPLTLQNICGVPVLMPQIAPIFNEFGTSISGSTVSITVGSVKSVTYLVTSLIVERVGKKPLLIISSIGTGVPLTVLGIFFNLKYNNSPIIYEYSWVPLASMLASVLFFGVGLGPVPVAMVSEFFPTEMRSAASSVIFSSVCLLFSAYITVYPILSEAIGNHWCIWVFCFTCFLGAFLFHILLPETKGKSVAEIQEIIKKY